MALAEERREIPEVESVSDKKARATAAPEPPREGDGEASLGRALASARERRGISREQAAGDTRIPGHYLAMMESNDYSKISDQLYVLPFLRRYAEYLQLDPEETAMRFVREVQRADNSPPPVRLAEPLDDFDRRKRRNWTGIVVIIGLIAVLIGAYVVESRHRDSADSSSSTTVVQAAPAPAAGAPASGGPPSSSAPHP
jgi:cytoskeletal protein RodZ